MSEQKQSLVAFDAFKKALSDDNFKAQIKNALPKHLTPDRCLRVALTAGLKQPKLAMACQTPAGKASLYKALLTASQLGLEVDGRQAHLVPFNDRSLGMIVQLIPGYQGMIDMAYNHEKVKSIWAEVVYAEDEFTEAKGSDRVLIHHPYDGDGDPGELRAAYAVAELEGGAKSWVVLRKRDIERIRSSSASWRYAEDGKKDSIWHTNPEPMWKKSAVRQLCKFIPQSSQLRRILDKDDESEAVDVASSTTVDVDPFPVEEPTEIAAVPQVTAADPQNDLRADLIGALDTVSYMDFQTWYRIQFQEDLSAYGSYDDLPLTVVNKLLAAPKLLEKLRKTFGKKA